jgi:hypothetical protein
VERAILQEVSRHEAFRIGSREVDAYSCTNQYHTSSLFSSNGGSVQTVTFASIGSKGACADSTTSPRGKEAMRLVTWTLVLMVPIVRCHHWAKTIQYLFVWIGVKSILSLGWDVLG